ncbi:MFS transporter [Bifidobacterium eulemuris]|uniref:MFS transporter n=1 Tax=Bifidobacterium eulemuris TaxID=1765219 RepID=A0A261FY84_9BIFI|nr:MFS transporter [Bifidobacterium eulemuris]OZG64058.1 MFS transporter [Bifidobacterium eulemuris]QOL32564.1 MFS transporter [Bifidobacterium eulemuris]
MSETVTANAGSAMVHDDPLAKLPQSGGKRVMLKAAILSLALLLQSISVTAAVVSSLKQDFPDASVMELQGFVTVPVLGNIIATLVGGRIAPIVGKKNLCIIGTLLCFIGGFLPMFVPILNGQTALRVLAGFGLGLIQPLSASLIVDCFKGKEADTLMGFQSSAVGLGATIISSCIAGVMTFDWHYFYFVYCLALVVMVIVMLFIPNAVNEIGRERKSADNAPKKRTKMPLSAYFGMILQIVFATGYGFYSINLSLAAEETGVITATEAATVITVVSISSLIGGLFFGLVKRFVGMWIGLLALGMNAAALLIWANTASMALWCVAGVLLGVGFCWFMPYVNLLVNEQTDPSISAQATSYAFFGNSVGSFIPSYVFAALGALTGMTSTWKSLNMGAVFLVICMVMVLALMLSTKAKANRAAAQAA